VTTVPEALSNLEGMLDPADPQRMDGLRVLGYGEVSVALTWEGLPGRVLKRMSGFRDTPMVDRYQQCLGRYLPLLAEAGVATAPTEVVPVSRDPRPPVVFLVQPLLPPEQLGNRLLAAGAGVEQLVGGVLEALLRLRRAQRPGPPLVEVTVDAQLSNWWFPADRDALPTLVDVGWPLVRTDGVQDLEPDLILQSGPAPIRPFFRRAHTVERYWDDYFDPRLVTTDLLANFHKEGAADRIDDGLVTVNTWLAENADELGSPAPVTRREVDRYYRADVRLLEFYLRVRRLDRAVHRRLGRPYDFVLPGPVRRR